MNNIFDIAKKAKIDDKYLIPFGYDKAKIDLKIMDELKDRPNGKLVLVTAITPTKAGEGKTTTSIGLHDGLNLIGVPSMVALREPSLGPVFGIKGGATGGGKASVIPSEDINLHFTGDMHALTSSINLISAVIDNHIFQGNELGIDPERILWKRALDMNDRALRKVTVMQGEKKGKPREDEFVITVASEMMAILCLANNPQDFQDRVNKIIVAYNFNGEPVTIKDLKISHAIMKLMKNALNPNLVQTLEGNPAIIHGGPFANIAHGCNSIMATKLALKLITLLGQNVNAYGKDLDEQKDFADLLEAVAKTGIERLRFATSHPWDFSSKMIDIIAKYPNIMKFIHLPVQSGNDKILKLMGRRYSRQQYLDLVKEMRTKIPGLSLSTDIIVGFPNETEEEFQDTVTLVDEVKYEAAFTFIYSPRKGTPAAKIEDNVPYATKSKRFIELVKHLEKHIEEKSNKMVGNVYKVLVDGVSKTDDSMLSGYTEENKLVHFKGDESLIGTIIDVKITESHTYSLIGEIVNG